MGLVKYLTLLLCPLLAHGFDVHRSLNNDFSQIEEIIKENTISPEFKPKHSFLTIPVVDKILSDPLNIVHKDLKVDPYWYIPTRFWFSIYTQYTTRHVVFHDKNNLGLVYEVIDYSDLSYAPLNSFVRRKIQNRHNRIKKRKIIKNLENLRDRKKLNNPSTKQLKWLIQASNLSIPRKKSARYKFFNKLIGNLRAQTGQREQIFQGVINSLPYRDYMLKLAGQFRIPRDLLAIPFLESSFNTKAVSKVGASGIWQIMPIIGRRLFPKEKKVLDFRRNVFFATVGAMHLLKQNHRILKSWDLAITAYNSGTKHLLRAKRKLKLKKMKLKDVFEGYKHPHLGFASKNFFAEFLALAHVLAYKDIIFPLEGVSDIEDQPSFNTKDLGFYISLCGYYPKKLFNAVKANSKDIFQINNHIRNIKIPFKRGSLLVSDVPLDSKRYYNVSFRKIARHFPRHWKKFISNQSCSMR
ncbi:MAG: transglycosylase SLT domain-containing protein [Bacteriovoracaceae bacterium]|jgi:membrane-bound lytic murein transglycosylase D|nr:transglycosylase SLT domain-containing protein [Bacteriovoracaceae bacterium]